MLHAVVMAGGSGTRFWPLSRAAVPKQLLAFATPRPLVVETVERLEGLVPAERVHVVTNAAYAERVRELLPAVPGDQVIPEPCGRDTAPCIALAAALIAEDDPDGVMAVLAADHVIEPAGEFRTGLARGAAVVARSPRTLVTFGIRPTRAATGYGYIERGAPRGEVDGVPWYEVAAFREKPDQPTAEQFVQSGRFLWNGGIFLWRADAILERLERHLPELMRRLPAVVSEMKEKGRIAEATFAALPRISIDFGILEKDQDVAVLEAAFRWDDVGSFAALERVLAPDPTGNVAVGEVSAVDARGNVLVGRPGHRVAVLGVRDLVVVATADVTLVCRKEDAERVKEMVEALRREGATDLL